MHNLAASFVAASNEFFSLADSATTVWGEDGNGATIALWANISASSGYGLLFGRTNLEGINVYIETGAASPIYVNVKEGGQLSIPVSAGWHLIIAWYDPVAKRVKASVDNGTTVVSGDTGAAATIPATTLAVRSGGWDFGNANALVDEIAVYNRVLTAAEHTDLWNGGAGLFYGS
jgi:hypothetical protein